VDWSDYYSLLQGAAVTVALSLAGIALGLPAGLGLALIRWRRVSILDPTVAVFVSLLRAAPAVTLGLLVYFALPTIGLSIEPIPAAILTLVCPPPPSTARSGAAR